MVCLGHSLVNQSSATLDETILLDKLVQGDHDAFWELWNRHRDYLACRCRVWMGGNSIDGEEALSLAMFKAWEKLPAHGAKITNVKAWLTRMTHNLCVDLHRQRKHKAIGVDNVEDISLNHHEIGSSDYPELELLQQEQNIFLRHCIDSLSSRLRDPLILSYYQSMSHAEIARKLSISTDNVTKRLQQAKQILKQQLSEYLAGLNTENLNETQRQELEQKDFIVSNNDDSNIEEINYRITISCLETLSPVWLNFHHHQD